MPEAKTAVSEEVPKLIANDQPNSAGGRASGDGNRGRTQRERGGVPGGGDTRNPQEDSERSYEMKAKADHEAQAEAGHEKDEHAVVAEEDSIRPKVAAGPEPPRHH